MTKPTHFLSEPLTPVGVTFDAARMAAGEPGLPAVFRWRDQEVRVTGVVRTWRDTGPCRHGSGERYVRKHWFEITTAAHGTMKVYFERQARRGAKGPRWWVFSLAPAPPPRLTDG